MNINVNEYGQLQIEADLTSGPIRIKGPDSYHYPDGDYLEVSVDSHGALVVTKQTNPLDFWSWLNLEENAHFKSMYLEWEKEMEEKNSVQIVSSGGCVIGDPVGNMQRRDSLTLGYEETTLPSVADCSQKVFDCRG